MASKSTWITAGLLSAAAAGAAALAARRRRHRHEAQNGLQALADFEPHPHDAGRHKKERMPRKLKKQLHHAEAVGQGGSHW
ncbi:hypothetical protein CS0771_67680 [Catellatospora sp. IY07-71]|uniref:hypothetical protein n=1 Tax=Catellatospora sp. IY07-71 TaxID=2728827 RepID=UPI001BB314C4|nr:hypothetical protein [Catellatospora sp. IY07-71]BCJ77224.1 hypothetical protein CS0771_67680 [Catellatospora sp. IY07-71]